MGESMDELLNAEFKEAFDEFDKVAASFKDVIYQFGPLGMTFVTATPTLGCSGSSHIEGEADRTSLGGPSRIKTLEVSPFLHCRFSLGPLIAGLRDG